VAREAGAGTPIRSMVSVWLGEFALADAAAEIVVPTTPFASSFFVFVFDFPICRCIPLRSQLTTLFIASLLFYFYFSSAQFGFDCTVHMVCCSPQ